MHQHFILAMIFHLKSYLRYGASKETAKFEVYEHTIVTENVFK